MVNTHIPLQKQIDPRYFHRIHEIFLIRSGHPGSSRHRRAVIRLPPPSSGIRGYRRYARQQDRPDDGRSIGHTGVMEARGYGALRPYVVPETLEELAGPTKGVITLPRHLDWGPERQYRLDQIADVRLMYMRVIRESATPDDLRRFLNAALLLRLWGELVLPPRVRALWHDRFPELKRQAA